MTTTIVDSDTLSELARGHLRITEAARRCVIEQGRLTLSAVTVFERLRGYRSAIARGKPLDMHMKRFVELSARSTVLPIDAVVADHAATIWSVVGTRSRAAILDLLIVATASAHGAQIATRNVRDFSPLARAAPHLVTLVDWARAT